MHVPDVIPHLSSQRIVTSEWVHGVPIDKVSFADCHSARRDPGCATSFGGQRHTNFHCMPAPPQWIKDVFTSQTSSWVGQRFVPRCIFIACVLASLRRAVLCLCCHTVAVRAQDADNPVYELYFGCSTVNTSVIALDIHCRSASSVSQCETKWARCCCESHCESCSPGGSCRWGRGSCRAAAATIRLAHASRRACGERAVANTQQL